jgi:hypothetical protein
MFQAPEYHLNHFEQINLLGWNLVHDFRVTSM